MEQIPATVFIGLGAIVAALISGFISFINLTITKDQKTSEFRQQWINSLREEISEYLGVMVNVKASWSIKQHTSEDPAAEFFNENIVGFEKIHTLYCKIVLRLNAEEHKDFVSTLTELDTLMSKPENFGDHQKIVDLNNELVVKSQKILKDEWTRVKTGEKSYILTRKIIRYFILGLFFSILFVAIVA